jgi:monoamine oxidase
VEFHTSTRMERIEQDADGVTVHDQHGRRTTAWR